MLPDCHRSCCRNRQLSRQQRQCNLTTSTIKKEAHMIRQAIYTLFAISALMLGGCATTGGTTSATIVQIQQAAVIACGFLPTVSTVANILVAPIAGPAGVAASM